MRVLIDARKANDFGIGTYIRGLVRSCCRLRPEWEFVLVGAPEQVDASPAAWFGDNARWLADRSSKYSLRELSSLTRHARDTAADLFHAPHYVYPVGLRCPGVVTIHDCIHLRFPRQLPRPLGFLPRALSRRYAHAMMRHAVRSASCVIAVSEATRRDLIEWVGAPEHGVVTIFNGTDPYFGQQPPADLEQDISERLRLPERYVLFVGNAKPHKNLPRLIEAFGRIAAADPGLQLLLVGRVGAIEALTASVGSEAAARIRDLGFVDRAELRTLYRRASVLCMPSLFEGFGLPALEAMACGTPVVAAEAGALPELIGDAGILVPPGRVEAIAAGLDTILRDPERAASLAAAGPERAAHFSWERAARETLAQYEVALHGSTPA